MTAQCDLVEVDGFPSFASMTEFKPYCWFSNPAHQREVRIKLPVDYQVDYDGVGTPMDLTCGGSGDYHHTIVVKEVPGSGPNPGPITVLVPYVHDPGGNAKLNLYVFDDHIDLAKKKTRGHSKSAVPVKRITGADPDKA